ncbi:transcriptional activator acu-15 [Fusarium pseudocircinatum]|uniref:Transcriptional activator acu-15 n=1 Tax=Fusarium pseudocircinatum TaxID=56676 RepID=A0A8H5NVF1_9HYPO|nr:transcriptional activator acu-15 [Fusarium pseudocircinatum]
MLDCPGELPETILTGPFLVKLGAPFKLKSSAIDSYLADFSSAPVILISSFLVFNTDYCDGRKPKCGRCEGYGFTCLYAKTRSRRNEVSQDDGWDASSSNAIDELRDGIDGYDHLIRRLLDSHKEDKLDSKKLHNQVKDRVRRALDRVALLTGPPAPITSSPSDQDRSSQLLSSQNQHRYLGEVSDVHFFNLVKGFLQTKDSSNPVQDFDSYEQDGEVPTANNESNGHALLPAPVETRALVEVYFSTIHIAYPFIPQSPFMANLTREGGIPNNATDLATLYVICAIGSYYTSFPGRDVDSQTRHECYFQRAMALAAATSGHHSIQQVDRQRFMVKDCSVALPSRRADNEIDWASDTMEPPEAGPSAGDYFIAVIDFSRIVGRVLRDIYGPVHSRPTPEMILSTQDLDRRLVEWKLGLPRKLRFDLGHSFDQNITFRRQRNMLAIKFHHLRALLHRPYLCYPLLHQRDDSSMSLSQLDWPLIAVFERICIDEAQGTARLLHHVSDEQELVHEFPWWQMISCLICAGSILLVSSIFAQQLDDHNGFDSEGLRDDAETCLKIFEALSSNSKSARIARNMIQGLKQSGSEWRKQAGRGADVVLFSQTLSQTDASMPLEHTSATEVPISQEMLGLQDQNVELLSDAMSTPQNWPAEITESMAWSSQFLDTIQGDGSWI